VLVPELHPQIVVLIEQHLLGLAALLLVLVPWFSEQAISGYRAKSRWPVDTAHQQKISDLLGLSNSDGKHDEIVALACSG